MENPIFSHHNDQGYLTEQRESHWLPALRPNEDVSNDAHTTNPSTLPQPRQQMGTQRENAAEIHVSQRPDSSMTEEDDILAEEDEQKPDPAWNFKHTSSVHLLDSAHRSSSFPTVTDTSEHAAKSQVFMHGTAPGEDEIDFNDLLNNANPSTDPVLEGDLSLDHNVAFETDYRAEDLDTIQEPTESLDNRFEEGIPLIPHAQPVESGVHHLDADPFQTNFGATDENDGDTSFFSEIQKQSVGEHAQTSLERKSTEDVLDALHMERRRTDNEPTEEIITNSEPRHEEDNQEVQHSAVLPAVQTAEEGAESKWAAVLDDDEEFLVEDADDLLPDSEPGSPSSFIAGLQGDDTVPAVDPDQSSDFMDLLNQKSSIAQPPTNPYAPHQPSTADMMQLSPKTHGNVGLTRSGLAPMGSFQNHVQQPSIVQRAESFVDQAKGGYKSPYDLPMEISKPKKRPQAPRAASQSQQTVPPPPRSSSMSSQKQLQSPFSPTNTTFGQTPGNSVASPPIGNRVTSAPGPSAAAHAKQQSNSSSFFVELPMISRSRPSPAPGRYTPSQNSISSPPPPPLPSASPPVKRQSVDQTVPSPPQTSDSYAQFQLRPPERIDPYANIATQAPSLPVPTASANRYSPAPGAAPGAPRPTASPRYSPAPPPQATAAPGRYASQPTQIPPTTASPYLPRTSSPLAYQGKPPQEQASNLMPPPPLPKPTSFGQPGSHMQSPPRQSTPPTDLLPQSIGTVNSPSKTSETPGQSGFTPLRRSQTQSPSKQLSRSSLATSVDYSNNRPASAYSQTPMGAGFTSPEQVAASRFPGRVKAAAPELDLEQPQDETQHDPLQRWRGAPIFKFGFGGNVITSFPRYTPRYRAGQVKPQMKPSAGEVKTRITKEFSLLPENTTTFPGPLKGKNKKKDLLSWMTSAITNLERRAPVMLGPAQTLPDPRKCHEELILLWKIVKIIVENDGVIENKPDALKALNIILSPEVHAIDESTASQYRADTELTGIYRPAGFNARSESSDPQAVESIRKHLLKGERDQAVWKAADSRLWSHAFLIASTVNNDRKLWRQVVQEFVRQEVKTIGNNSESLSALYEIFGGNMEESIDQLVPPSARAGLQMVSTVESTGPTKNALDGLDRWKETLSLVLNNRTPDDQRALATLGALLGTYGRIEAAHICFLFARNPLMPNIFGGADDPQASVTLLGSDQKAKPLSFHQDHDALLLTEAYEFAVSTLAPAPMSVVLPHLAAYKYQKALDLADNGFKNEAQAYCEAITAGITSKSKVSPYYHTSLLVEVDELTKRLKQVPVQSTSWMAKPSVEKATNSLLSKLSNFVAGDDSDAESKGSAADIGPFAKSSGSPVLSRSGSQTDLSFGSYSAAQPSVSMTAAGSRYAPGGVVSPRASIDLIRGRASLDSQRSPPTSSHGYEPRQSRYAPSPARNQYSQSPARSINSYQPYGTSPSRGNYQATPPQHSYMAEVSTSQPPATLEEHGSESYMPTASADQQQSYMPTQPEQNVTESAPQPSYGGYTPSMQTVPEPSELQADVSPSAGYEQPQSYGYGYEPPADGGYVPYQPEPDSDEDSSKPKPKKKSFIDQDDGDYARMSSPSIAASRSASDDAGAAAARKKANDEAADAAFRAAAEADAQRAKDQAAQKKASGSWLGGWFGGKKTDNSLDAAPKSSGGEPKVFKAKLGENKMKLYYDKDLKKWVNPDDPDSLKAKSATPPPPPGRSSVPPPSAGSAPPPRPGSTPLPPVVGSRASTPGSTAGGDPAGLGIAASLPPSVNAGLGLPNSRGTPPPQGTSPAPASASGLAPPSRPASNASSIDDLIGPAAPRKTGKGARAPKKGRYVDVMAQ